jgi:hypothetical protein
MRENWDMISILPKFGLCRVLLSIEGTTSDPAKVSSRGPTKVNFSWSLFQLLFLLPLVDPFLYDGGINCYKLFEADHILSGAFR